MNKSTSQVVLQILVSIAMIVFYVFIAYNVIDGLMEATAIQGFSGIMLLLIGFVALVVSLFNLDKLFD